MEEYSCFVCGSQAPYQCVACKIQYYCSQTCQKEAYYDLHHERLCPVMGDGLPEDFEVDFERVCEVLDAIEHELSKTPFLRPELSKKRGRIRRSVSLSPAKARKILRDGSVHGRPLTNKQKRFFGWVAGGGKK